MCREIRKPQKGDAMALILHTDPIPLRVDEHGVIRVGDSQVLLDIVIREFNNGAEPEAIAHGFPTLNLADVYGAIAYYLRHRTEVDNYLDTRRQEAEKLRQEIEARQPSRLELRAKLLAREAQGKRPRFRTEGTGQGSPGQASEASAALGYESDRDFAR
jgi:uncharacterized protein (DUF433 family)